MSEPEVLFEVKSHAGLITLNRPRALNALTLGMIRDITASLRRWMLDDAVRHVIIRSSGGKAFCAGGDIRALYDWGRRRDPIWFDFYRQEYQLNTLIKRYPKPYIALIDGIFMGGGVGLSVHGSHRVGTERLTFAMPEVGIGFFPDVGGSYFLPRLPGVVGTYLGLTGERLGVADTCDAGITTHHVPSERLDELADALCDSTDVGGCLAAFRADPGPARLSQHRQGIDRNFSHGGVDAIVESLEAAGSDWAKATAAELGKKSPTSLKVTFRQLREGLRLDFEECMRMEYRMAIHMRDGHDFFEGIRAVVIDKDQKPRWRPARLHEVSDADVAAYFAPLEEELPV
jgi:enoyl-CoA hydratase